MGTEKSKKKLSCSGLIFLQNNYNYPLDVDRNRPMPPRIQKNQHANDQKSSVRLFNLASLTQLRLSQTSASRQCSFGKLSPTQKLRNSGWDQNGVSIDHILIKTSSGTTFSWERQQLITGYQKIEKAVVYATFKYIHSRWMILNPSFDLSPRTFCKWRPKLITKAEFDHCMFFFIISFSHFSIQSFGQVAARLVVEVTML